MHYFVNVRSKICDFLFFQGAQDTEDKEAQNFGACCACFFILIAIGVVTTIFYYVFVD